MCGGGDAGFDPHCFSFFIFFLRDETNNKTERKNCGRFASRGTTSLLLVITVTVLTPQVKCVCVRVCWWSLGGIENRRAAAIGDSSSSSRLRHEEQQTRPILIPKQTLRWSLVHSPAAWFGEGGGR